jgi:hypothetical protein
MLSTLDKHMSRWTRVSKCARVAELEDAVDLKSIVRKGVWVRVPPRALGSACGRLLVGQAVVVGTNVDPHPH